MKNYLFLLFMFALLPTHFLFSQHDNCQNIIHEFEQKGLSASILIAEGDQILFEHHSEENFKGKKFLIGSLTKQFTAAAILSLVDKDQLSLDDSLINYLKGDIDISLEEEWNQITIQHLLQHTSGLFNYTNSEKIDLLSDTPLTSDKKLFDLFMGHKLLNKPGEVFNYSNSGYFLLGKIIEQITGQTWFEYLERSVLNLENLKDTGFRSYADNKEKDLMPGFKYDQGQNRIYMEHVKYNVTGWANAAGGLHSTTHDLHRWNKALFSEKFFDLKYEQLMIESGVDIPDWPNLHYGYGTILERIGDHMTFWHFGDIANYSAVNFYLPKKQLSVIILANMKDSTMLIQLAHQLLNEVI